MSTDKVENTESKMPNRSLVAKKKSWKLPVFIRLPSEIAVVADVIAVNKPGNNRRFTSARHNDDDSVMMMHCFTTTGAGQWCLKRVMRSIGPSPFPVMYEVANRSGQLARCC